MCVYSSCYSSNGGIVIARNYDETYLDGLIAKAKKSWEGVDVESYMSDLRDNDMKTIEERAKANLAYEQDFCGHSLSENMVCRAYVRGATEQKAIDIDKACEWLERANSALPPCYKMFEVNIENFRKAMEE